MFHKPGKVCESCLGWWYSQELPKGGEKQLWLVSRRCSVFPKCRLGLWYLSDERQNQGWRCLQCPVRVQQEQSCISLFQKSLSPSLLQFRLCCSTKLNTYSRVNMRGFFQGNDFVGTQRMRSLLWAPEAWRQVGMRAGPAAIRCWMLTPDAGCSGLLGLGGSLEVFRQMEQTLPSVQIIAVSHVPAVTWVGCI